MFGFVSFLPQLIGGLIRSHCPSALKTEGGGTRLILCAIRMGRNQISEGSGKHPAGPDWALLSQPWI